MWVRDHFTGERHSTSERCSPARRSCICIITTEPFHSRPALHLPIKQRGSDQKNLSERPRLHNSPQQCRSPLCLPIKQRGSDQKKLSERPCPHNLPQQPLSLRLTIRSALVTAHDTWPSIRASLTVSRTERRPPSQELFKHPSASQRFLTALPRLQAQVVARQDSRIGQRKEGIHTTRTIQCPPPLRHAVILSSPFTQRTLADHQPKLVHTAHAQR